MTDDRDERATDDARRLDWLASHRADVFHADGEPLAVSILRPIYGPDGLRCFAKHDAATVRAAIDAAMADDATSTH